MDPELWDIIQNAGGAGAAAFLAIKMALNGLKKDVEQLSGQIEKVLDRQTKSEVAIAALKVKAGLEL